MALHSETILLRKPRTCLLAAPLKPAQISPTLCLGVFGSDPVLRQKVFLGVWACQAELGSDPSKEGARKELAGN